MINGNQKTYTLAELREKAKQCIDDLDDQDLRARLYLSTFLAWLENHKNERPRSQDQQAIQ